MNNPMLATINLNAPKAPEGRRRFMDYLNELKEPHMISSNGLIEVKEADGSTESFKSEKTIM